MGIGQLAGILISYFAGSLLVPAQVPRFAISQVDPQLPTMIAFVDVVDANGQTTTKLSPANFSATLGAHPVRVAGVRSFETSGDGVAYALVVDISRSISSSDFKLLRAVIEKWITSLQPRDRVAVCTFGDTYKVVSNFESDTQQLSSTVMALELHDLHTRLFDAIRSTIQLEWRVNSDLPVRRAAVLFSDGKDEGSAITATEVVQDLQSREIPVYAIGYSRLPKAQRRQYLEVLRRFADLSGGTYEEATTGSLERVYASLQRAILRVFILNLSCPDCPADGRSYPLQITFSQAGRSLMRSLNITPLSAPAPRRKPRPARERGIPLSAWILIGLGVAGIVLLLAFVFKKRPQPTPEPLSVPKSAPPPEMAVAVEPVPLQAAAAGGVSVELGVVTGEDAGRTYQLQLRNTIVIGRAKDCDLVLNDPRVSSRHCEMALSQTSVIIYDLDSKNSTYVNGVPIQGRHKLATEDLLRVGETEFRLHFDEL